MLILIFKFMNEVTHGALINSDGAGFVISWFILGYGGGDRLWAKIKGERVSGNGAEGTADKRYIVPTGGADMIAGYKWLLAMKAYGGKDYISELVYSGAQPRC